jgi:hypothetical protein
MQVSTERSASARERHRDRWSIRVSGPPLVPGYALYTGMLAVAQANTAHAS